MRRWALLAAAAFLLASPATADIVFMPKSGGGTVITTAGASSITGTTSQTLLVSLKIPANSMGKNGVVEIKGIFSYPNSSNNKVVQVYFNSNASANGLILAPLTLNTTAAAQTMWIVRNSNAANAQSAYAASPSTSPFGTTTTALAVGAIDTTQDAFVNIFGTLALGTETLTLQHAYAAVYSAP